MALLLVVAQVVLAAPPPDVDFTISPDSAPEVGQSRSFSATATDPEGDPLTYEWDFEYDGTFNLDASGHTTSHIYNSSGTRSVALRVTDATPESVLKVKSVHVTPPNQEPSAQISCTPPQVNEGQAVSCTSAGSTDADGGIVRYEWSVDDGAFTVGGPTFSTTLAAGDDGHTITLRVTDNDGASATATSGQISVNASPVADIQVTAAAPTNLPADAQVDQAVNQLPPTPTPLVGQTVIFDSSQSTDAGGSIAARAWDVDGDGFDDGTGETLQHVFADAGSKTIQLRVTDNSGAEATDAVNLRVNRLPVPGFITDDPTPVINQNLAFSSTSTDPDNDISTFQWDFDNDGTFGEGGQSAGITCQNPQSADASCSFSTAGTYTVRLRITDTGGISRTAARQILIQNSVPSVAFSYQPDAPLPGAPVTFSSTSTATAGKQIIGYEWDFAYDGTTFKTDATGASVSHAFSSAGPKTVALKVTEAPPGGDASMGGYDIVTRTITVNAGPRSGFTVAPENGFVGEPVTLSSTSADPDGPLTRQEWDLDNDGQFDDANAAVVSATFGRAGAYPLKLRVTDSRGATAVSTGQVTIGARPLPVLTGVVISIRGRVARKATRVTRLLVRAPRGSRVVADCVGKRCPKRLRKKVSRVSKGSKRLRFKRLERKLRPKAKLVVTVSRTGFIGKRTTFKIRRGKDPRRQDLCLVPGAKKASACPPG